MEDATRMQHFEASDGLRLAYVVDDFVDAWRDPRPVVLLHAAMGDALRYSAWVPVLAARHRVIRMDLRGHGRSQVPAQDSHLDMDRLVEDVCELMDHLGLDAAHFIGNSAGGYVAQNLALTHPQRVRSLALFGSPPGLKNSQATTWIPQVAEKGLRTFVTETIADRFDLANTAPERMQWFIDSCADNDPQFIMRFVALMASLEWGDQVHRIAVPTLVVIPGNETVGPASNYDVMRETMPDAEFVTLNGLPHNICDAVPERCAREALAFLERRFG